MTDSDSLVMIYDYKEGASQKPSAYYLLHAFDETGLMDLDSLIDTYEDFTQKQPENYKMPLGPFDSLALVNQFAFKVCEKSKSSLVSLVSVSQYNEILETAESGSTLFQDFIEKGNKIENLDHSSKKGILGKIFH